MERAMSVEDKIRRAEEIYNRKSGYVYIQNHLGYRLLLTNVKFNGTEAGKNAEVSINLENIGFGNIVSANRLVAIVSPESAPIKRIIQEARDRGMLIDASFGRRTRAVIITDSDHVILSAVQPETIAHRLSTKEEAIDEVDE